jgi:2-oxoglutarate ferredoxin oxidoreductase subunit delta
MPVTTNSKQKAGEKKPVFDPARCKRCGICARFCPFDAIALKKDGTPYLAKPEACTSCRLCQDMCPDWAIGLVAESAGEADEDRSADDGKTEDEKG